MKTRIIKINKNKIDIGKIRDAASIIRKGGLVAFPTETVYGLGASAFDKRAVAAIFRSKGRPGDNPIIVHIAVKEDVFKVAKEVDERAIKLIEKFWPGPLTIVLKKNKKIANNVSKGLNTVAVRMPKHKIANLLIKESGVPIAAPSANLSGRPSPTNAKHAIEDLNGRVDAIIDGGDVDIGVESTVIDLSSDKAVVLRPGKISLKELRKTIGEVKLHDGREKKAKSPGMKYKHYSPNARVIVVKGNKKNFDRFVKLYSVKGKVGVVDYGNINLMAKNLFKRFREYDNKRVDYIIVKWSFELKDGFEVGVYD